MKTRKQENKKTSRHAIRYTCPQRQQPARQRLGAAMADGAVLRGGRALYAIRCSWGFTIVELLVAVGLFLTLIAVLSGAFVEALRSERATLRLMAANDAASFALEQMAREIRVGTDFALAGQSELHFINSAGREVMYRLANGRVEKRMGASSAFLPVTPNTVRVETLHFALTGERKTDNLQPRLTIALAVGATGRDIGGVVTRVQTTITPRLLDTP